MIFKIRFDSIEKIIVDFKTFDDDWEFATDSIREHISIMTALTHERKFTYRCAFMRAMLMINLYSIRNHLKSLMSSLIYLNLIQSWKLVWVSVDHDEHFKSFFLKSLQALLHLSNETSSAEKSISKMAWMISVNEFRIALKALSSFTRLHTHCWWNWKLLIIS